MKAQTLFSVGLGLFLACVSVAEASGLSSKPEYSNPTLQGIRERASQMSTWGMTATQSPIVWDDECFALSLPGNDDGSTGAIPLAFPLNFFGTTYSHLYVNNNGNVTFSQRMGSYTPFQLTAHTPPIIAPFFADVDTRGSGVAMYSEGTATFEGRRAFCVSWMDVGYYSYGVDKLNSFQLLLVDRSDTGTGNFDIVMNYDHLQWETGGASGGSGGLGGISAGAGFSAGNGDPNAFYQFPGSLVPGSFLDNNPVTALIRGSRGTPVLGRYIFQVRNGRADTTPPVSTATVTPGPDSNGRYQTPVTVAITATDSESGVQDISYSLSGATTGSGTVTGSSLQLNVAAEGVTTVVWYARDVAGNVETAHSMNIHIQAPDVTPPVSTATVTPGPDSNGHYGTPVTVSITATDSQSGVQSITYSLSGATTGGGTVAGSSLQLNVSAEGLTTLVWYARDVAGNVESVHSLDLRLVFAPVNGSWTFTGRLPLARMMHRDVLLPDGRVLVVGGFNRTTDLYNPATGTWSTTGKANYVRRFHTATLLPDGRALVTGGVDGKHSTSTELYDPATGIWTRGASMNVARMSHTATLLADGRVLVAGGGASGMAGSAEVYDPATNSWSFTGSLNGARASHTATLLPNGQVLVAGGLSGSTRLTSAEVYDAATGTWSATGNLGVARAHHTATLLPGGLVLVAGGGADTAPSRTSEVYDAATGTWTAAGDMAQPRRHHTALLLNNGKVFVTGGYDKFTGILLAAEVFDPATRTWSAETPMQQDRYYHTATLLMNGQVLVTAGVSNGDQSTCELFQP
jgi:hypothetical protein